MCRSNKTKKIQQVLNENEDDGDNFLGGVRDGHKEPGTPWAVTLQVDDTAVDFHIDTGAEVTLVSQSTHRAIGSPPLSPAKKNLKGPDNNSLPVKGCFRGKFSKTSGQVKIEQEWTSYPGIYLANQQ